LATAEDTQKLDMDKLFGTDGIRGIANSYPIIPEVAAKVGRVVASLFKGDGQQPLFIIGQDTRLSGDMIAYALASGISSAGVDAELVGVLPTPGVAFATRTAGAIAGVVVSASHNPYRDNGIKLFGSDGSKLSDQKEAEIENLVLSGNASGLKQDAGSIGRIRCNSKAAGDYAGFLKSCVSFNQDRNKEFKIVLDCANGATYEIAPCIFNDLGFAVETLNADPNGVNINDRCGSQHPEGLSRRVVADRADIGLGFDGDGDRLIAVDDCGEVLSGDRLLAICARHLQMQGRLKNNTVVSTVMSNVGLGRTLKDMGIRHLTTQVGDRYVMEGMRAAGAVLGGEDSGHMIFAEHHTTGDGILSALVLVDAVRSQGAPLSKLKDVMTPFPQVLINIAVKSKPGLDGLPQVLEVIRRVEQELGDSGRVLVRYSGTEPLCRVMVEGQDKEAITTYGRDISRAIKAAIG
jgi:phosphoglucosamine mutase